MNPLIKKPASLRNYKLSIPNGAQETFPILGDTIRLLSATVPISFVSEDGMLGFTLTTGDEALFDEATFFRFRIFHTDPAPQNIEIAIGNGGRIGSSKVNGIVTLAAAVALDAPTLAALESINTHSDGQAYGLSFKASSALAANTAETVFTPAANANGAILHSAQLYSFHASLLTGCCLLAKTTAPASIVDGDSILSPDSGSIFTGAVNQSASLKNPVRIPAGKGLYFISAVLEGAGGSRGALYTFL
jgi:hypothetical protein